MEGFSNKAIQLLNEISAVVPLTSELNNSKETNNINFDTYPEYNSICFVTRPKEDEVGLSSFVSKTKRGYSVSDVPGPGSYELNYRHEINKNLPSNFGSSVQRTAEVYRKNVNFPFTDPTYMENPPVGHYGQINAKVGLNRIRSMKTSLINQKPKLGISIKGERTTKQGFSSTCKREYSVKGDKSKFSPGPGAYDLTFKDIIKMMDQKLAIRYQISPFGSGKPRFNENNKTIEIINQNESSESMEQPSRFMTKDKHAASDILNEHYKNKEKYRNSYTYASRIQRFKGMYNNSDDDISKQTIQSKTPDLLFIDESQTGSKVFANNKSTHSISSVNQNLKKENNPFDAKTPRFPKEKKLTDVPGPGHYDPKDQLSSKKFNNVFVSEDREKYSLFKTIQKKSDELPAPSNYTINNNFSKKSYNATLPPKKFV